MRLTLIAMLVSVQIQAQESEFRPDWYSEDSVNFYQLITDLESGLILEDPIEFVRSHNRRYPIEHRKDTLGFGLLILEDRIAGGYMGIFGEILMYNNEVVRYKFSINESDNWVIDSLLQRDDKLRERVMVYMDYPNDYKISYKDETAINVAKKNAKNELGEFDETYIPKGEDANKYFNYLTDPFNQLRYGYGCGYTGSTMVSRYAIEYFYDNIDTTSLVLITKSLNPEGRLYGAEGLLRLAEEGKYSLTTEDKATIRFILTLDIPLSRCQGCVVSHSTASKLLERKYRKLVKK